MNFVFNDLIFFYSFTDEYAIKEAVNKLVDVLLDIRNYIDNVQLIYNQDTIIHNQELMPQYPMAKMYHNKLVKQDRIRVILQYLSRMKTIDCSNAPTFIFEGNESKLCGYAAVAGIPVISLQVNINFENPILIGKNKENEKLSLYNISKSLHINVHSHILNIRVYELNPKHKIGYNWGSPMDLDDHLAQKVLDEAIVYEDDEKCLVNYYNGNFYIFRRHINNCYHGYINNNIPEKIKRKFGKKN